eukprot:9260633-Ditylum_brightwellii.AAC.1
MPEKCTSVLQKASRGPGQKWFQNKSLTGKYGELQATHRKIYGNLKMELDYSKPDKVERKRENSDHICSQPPV